MPFFRKEGVFWYFLRENPKWNSCVTSFNIIVKEVYVYVVQEDKQLANRWFSTNQYWLLYFLQGKQLKILWRHAKYIIICHALKSNLGAAEIAPWVRILALQAWGPSFNPHLPAPKWSKTLGMALLPVPNYLSIWGWRQRDFKNAVASKPHQINKLQVQ